MAFRMTRPTIQGTEYHKASVLKAKAETVAQTRTAADPTLVAAGSELGKSNISKAIDFTIKPAEIKIPEGDGKKKKPVVVEEKTKVEAKVEPKKVVEPTVEKVETKIGKPKVEKIIVGTPTSITADEEVAKNNAEIQAQIDEREARKEKDYQDRLRKAQEEKDQKAKELEENNKAIRERNKAIVEAKKFYGITGDGKLTQTQLDEYQNMRVLQEQNEAKYQQNPIEIEEESDREWNQAPPGRETVSNRSDLQKGGKYMDVDNDGTPDFIQKPTQVKQDVQPTATTTSQTTQNVTNTKPKLSDFKDGKNAFGGHVSKNQAYNEAMKKWRRENPNPIQMRNDAIYKNAIKDGIVQKNMIKSGYKPLD
jgi:hypothetical protein